jgi:23S rRNA G2069 N7-methylase RlmK/C1962 C5-methylase RlmI
MTSRRGSGGYERKGKVFELNRAWQWREAAGYFERATATAVNPVAEAFRVFHGPGEGQGSSKFFAVDRFGEHFWITEWESAKAPSRPIGKGTQPSGTSNAARVKVDATRAEIIKFLRAQGAKSIVGLSRPEQGIAPESQVFFGMPPTGRFEVKENGCQFWIQLEKTRHPGLFLDHEPLRRWLLTHSRGLRVLNTFAYTGSLSVAAGVGGAASVTTLDLSQPSIQWAKENMALNGLTESTHRFISGDVFEWLPRLKKEKALFDLVILDPPSFSHGNKGRFSTAKDLEKLHSLAMELLNPKGILVTSINSANISRSKYESDVLLAARALKMNFLVLQQIDLPETFPTGLGGAPQDADRYLKGWILKRL